MEYIKGEAKINYLEKERFNGVKAYGGMDVQSNSLLLSGLASRLGPFTSVDKALGARALGG
jgi:hypothetical protein